MALSKKSEHGLICSNPSDLDPGWQRLEGHLRRRPDRPRPREPSGEGHRFRQEHRLRIDLRVYGPSRARHLAGEQQVLDNLVGTISIFGSRQLK